MPRRHARAVPRLRIAARRHERQPAGRPRHRREDRREAHHDVREPRRHLRPPRRLATEATHEPRRRERPCVQEPGDVAPDVRRRSRRHRAHGFAPGRVRPRAHAGVVQPARVPHVAAADAGRGRRRRGGSARQPRSSRSMSRSLAMPKPRRRRSRAAGNGERVAIEPRWEGPTVSGLAVSTGEDAVYIAGDLLADPIVRDALTALDRPGESSARRAPRQGADARVAPGAALPRSRHRGDGVPARSRRREVPARGSCASLSLARAHVPRPDGRHARLRRRRGRARDRAPGRGADRGWPTRSRKRSRRAGSSTSTNASSDR